MKHPSPATSITSCLGTRSERISESSLLVSEEAISLIRFCRNLSSLSPTIPISGRRRCPKMPAAEAILRPWVARAESLPSLRRENRSSAPVVVDSRSPGNREDRHFGHDRLPLGQATSGTSAGLRSVQHRCGPTYGKDSSNWFEGLNPPLLFSR